MNSKVDSPNSPPKWGISLRLAASLFAALTLVLTGCRVLDAPAKLTVDAVEAVIPTSRSVPIDPGSVQVEVLHYADDFIGNTTAAIDEYSHRANTTKARGEALRWKLAMNSSVVSITISPSPVANLIDFVSLATLMRVSVEERAPKIDPPGAFDAWLDVARTLETNAWKLASRVLDTKQQNQLRTIVDQRRAQDASLSASFLTRPEQLSSIVRETREKEIQPGGVFSLVGLDPMEGLDPAVREATHARLFAERALFASQRIPFLMRWQLELLYEQLLDRKETAFMLESVERLSKAADATSKTVAKLPDRFTAERKALIEALEAQEGKLSNLTAEANHAFNSANKMFESIDTTLVTSDTLIKRLGVGELSTKPKKPFNILDYAHTAEQITAMAQQLDTLVKDTSGTIDAPALNQRIASLNAVADRTNADARSVLNHAFLLMAGLIILGFGCAEVYRKTSRSP